MAEQIEQQDKTVYEKAIEVYEKLIKSVKTGKNKFLFIKATDDHLRQRLKESDALCQDLLQEGKDFEEMAKYVTDHAKKEAGKSSSIGIDNETVWEWMEDYIHRDEAAIQAKKKKEKEEAEAKRKERQLKAEEKKYEADKAEREKKKLAEKYGTKTEEKPEETLKPEPKKSKKLETDGQMSLFDFM